MHHRRPEFSTILTRTLQNLKQVFQTKQPCFMLPATGTGAMEAALVNVLSPGDPVLIIDAGKFGERWYKLAKTFDLTADHFTVAWGEDLNIDDLQRKLAERNYKALLVQACETSTGAAHPIKELGGLLQNSETLLVVDGITALAAYDIPMDDWHIDILIGGSQKGFMLPTGMAFVALSAKAWQQSAQSQLKKYYWDLRGELKANEEGLTRYSTPVQFVAALDKVLQDILQKQGLATFFATTLERAKVFREQVQLPVFAKTPSPSLSCLLVPEGISAGVIRDQLFAQDNIAVMCGQDHMKDRFIRVGHMGAMTLADLAETATAINRCLEK